MRTYRDAGPENDEFQLVSGGVADEDFDEVESTPDAVEFIPPSILAAVETVNPGLGMALRHSQSGPLYPSGLRRSDGQAIYVYCHGEHLCIKRRREQGSASGMDSPALAPA